MTSAVGDRSTGKPSKDPGRLYWLLGVPACVVTPAGANIKLMPPERPKAPSDIPYTMPSTPVRALPKKALAALDHGKHAAYSTPRAQRNIN